MAIQLTYTDPQTLAQYTNAYHRIGTMRLFPSQGTGDVLIRTYPSGTIALSASSGVADRWFQFSLPSVFGGQPTVAEQSMTVSQIVVSRLYTYLATLPEFQGATLV